MAHFVDEDVREEVSDGGIDLDIIIARLKLQNSVYSYVRIARDSKKNLAHLNYHLSIHHGL